MNSRALLLLVALLPASSQVTKTSAGLPSPAIKVGKGGIALGTFNALERRFDNTYYSIGDVDNPLEMLGPTQGVYLDGYGAVLATRFSLVATPGLSPFFQEPTPERVTRTRQQKLDRLPVLRQKMKALMQIAALQLSQIPENEQIVIAVRLDYRTWENTSGLPGQILMRATRKGAASLESIVTEDQ